MLTTCEHDNLINENGLEVCLSCGLELPDNYTFNDDRCVVLKPSIATLCYDAVDYGKCLMFLDDTLTIKAEVIRLFDHVVSTRKNIHQTQKTGIMAACTYHACVEMNAVRMIEEIVELFKITTKTFAAGCRVLYDYFPRFRFLDPPPSSYLTSVCRYVVVSDELREALASFLQKCDNAMRHVFFVNELNPSKFCFACVYQFLLQNDAHVAIKYPKFISKKKITLILDTLHKHNFYSLVV